MPSMLFDYTMSSKGFWKQIFVTKTEGHFVLQVGSSPEAEKLDDVYINVIVRPCHCFIQEKNMSCQQDERLAEDRQK